MGADVQVERYHVVRPIGSGGMGRVVLAEDQVLGRQVALKRLHTTGSPHELARLRREARMGAALSHPNIVAIYDVFYDEDDLVIVMEFVEGQTLRDVLRHGRLPTDEAIRVLSAVAAALDHAHAHGIVHRDVKPANILLGRDGAVKLADLGVAAAADRTRITTSGALLGTVGYMAPEQVEGAAPRPSADVYTLAAVAFEVLSGRRARPQDNPLAVAHAITTEPPPDLADAWPQAPAEAAAVLGRGMARTPAERPRSASELVSRLAVALEAQVTEEATPRRARRRRPPAPVPVAPEPSPHRSAVQPKRGAAALVPVPAAEGAASARDSTAPRRAAAGAPSPRGDAGSTRRRRTAALLALAAALAAALILAVVLASGSGSSHKTSSTKTAGTHPAAKHASRGRSVSTASTAPTAAPASPGAGSSQGQTGSSATTGSPAAPLSGSTGAGGAGTPVGAVETFYQLAAGHQYQSAWQLADPAFRAQLAGFSAFQSQQSHVRSIRFDSARIVSQIGSNATVAVQTTPVLDSGTQHCQGTVGLVSGSGGWLLHHIGINCNP